MSRAETWEEIAVALAARMEHQANRCAVGHGYVTEDGGKTLTDMGDVPHDPDKAAADGCPFCADTVAYRRFLARRAGLTYAAWKKSRLTNRGGTPC